jgi:class III poly(R)-hydroxyalkanoic acid synthase PhaE subunit
VSGPAGAAGAANWQDAWQRWVDAMRVGASGTTGDAAGRVSGLATAYLAFAKLAQEALAEGAGPGFSERLVALMARAATATGEAAADAAGNWLTVVPFTLGAAALRAQPAQAHDELRDTLSGWAAQLLALPAIGPQREWQQALARLLDALRVQDDSARALMGQYRLAFAAALARFGEHLDDESGPPIESLRALYDAWVEQAEAAYGERLRTPEFARAFAGWVNAGSATRLALRGLSERIAAALDLPQRAEIDRLLMRERQLQAELAELRDGLARQSAPPEPVVAAARPTAAPARSRPARSAAGGRAGSGGRTRKPRGARTPKEPRGAPEFDITNFLAGTD